MTMRKYTSIIFFENRPPMRLRMVTRDFRSFWYWLERNRYRWTAINVYDRNTSGFVTQLNRVNYWNKIKNL